MATFFFHWYQFSYGTQYTMCGHSKSQNGGLENPQKVIRGQRGAGNHIARSFDMYSCLA